MAKFATLPVLLSQMWIGVEYSARPREFQTGMLFSTLVSCNFPVGVTTASPWRIRFCSFNPKFLMEKEWTSEEFALVSSNRKKVMEMVRRRENGFWVRKLDVAMAFTWTVL